MADKIYGVLICGAGWVSSQHIQAYRNNPKTRVVAIADRKLENAKLRAEEAGLEGVAFYDNLGTALEQPGVDIVSVCTPQHVHCENVLAAAAKGKHIIIEKPIAINVDQMQRMQEAVEAAGVKTVVSFVLRWNPLFEKLKLMLADGAFGRPYYVETDYLSHNASWWNGWNDARTVKQGVSAMLVAGCHAIDAMRWFAAPGRYETANVVEVFAMRGGYRKGLTTEYNSLTNSWHEDKPPMEYDGLEVITVKFDNGALGKVTCNADCIMPYRFPIRIFGDRGSVFDNRIWSHQQPDQKDWIELPGIRPDSSDVSHHPFQAEIDHFVECIQTDTESHCSLADAIKTHEVVFAAQECYRTGLPVVMG